MNSVAEIFERIGGIDAAVTWAKNNRSTFYIQMCGKTNILQESPHVPDEKALWAVIENALVGAVGALYSNAPAATRTPILETPASSVDVANSDVRDAVSSDAGAAHGIADVGMKEVAVPQALHDGGISNTSHRKRRIKQPSSYVASVLAQPPKPKPLPPPPLEVKVAAPPQQPQQNQQPSATQLFLQWEGHQRMNWSPPRSWSGW